MSESDFMRDARIELAHVEAGMRRRGLHRIASQVRLAIEELDATEELQRRFPEDEPAPP